MQPMLRWLADNLGQSFVGWLLGVALTLIAPVWAYLAGAPGYITLTIIFACLAAILVVIREVRKLLHELWRTAELHLNVYGDERVPRMVSQDNIFRWYHLKNSVNVMQPSGQTFIAEVTVLFITFEKDIRISTLIVSSSDAMLPTYEIKEYNQRYAIIVFSGPLPKCNLEISAGK